MIKYIGKTLLIDEWGKKNLVIGDLHLGYEESMNLQGVFVARKMYDEMIDYFNQVFDKIGLLDEIIFLGDIKHNIGSILKQEWGDFDKLFDYFKEKCRKIVIIKGNHDAILKVMAEKKNIDVKEYYINDRYCFLHGDKDFPEIWDKKIKYLIVGHIHPAVKLVEKKGVKVEKYKCFLVGKFKGKNLIVVPSFIDYYEGSDVRDESVKIAWKINFSNFNVKIVGDCLDVLDFGKLKNI